MGILGLMALTGLLVCGAWIILRGAGGLLASFVVLIPIGSAAASAAAWLAPLAMIVEVLRYRGFPGAGRRPVRAVSVVVVVYLLVIAASGFWTPDQSSWRATIVAFLVLACQVIALALWSLRNEMRTVLTGWSLVLGAFSVIMLLWAIVGRPESWVTFTSALAAGDDRILNPDRLGHPWVGASSYAASFCMLGILISLPGIANRYVRLGTFLASVVALILTASRGAAVSVVVGLLVWAVLIPGANKTLKRLSALGLLLPVSYALIAAVATARTAQNPFLYDNGRFVIVDVALREYVSLRPLLGWGAGAWRELQGIEGGLHNIFLTQLIEGGVLLLAVFIVLIGIVLANFAANRRTVAGRLGLAVMSALIVNNTVEASLEGAYFRSFSIALLASLLALISKSTVHGLPRAEMTAGTAPGLVGTRG